MDPDEEPTCGKGVAANAALPEKMAAVLRGTADVLESHVRSLDPNEPAGKAEIDAYRQLIAEHNAIGGQLEALAATMRGYHDLPVASHDMGVIMDQRSVAVFTDLVGREQAFLDLMQTRVAEYSAMLREMRP